MGRPLVEQGSTRVPEAVYAALDVGSNTAHLLVATWDSQHLRPLDDRSTALRLGEDVELTGAIGAEKLAAAARAVAEYVARARQLGAGQVLVLATQAVRAAENRDAVVATLARAAGSRVDVLDAAEEARLAVRGAALSHPWAAEHLVVDVGGASTQLAVASADQLADSRSVPVGSVRLAARWSDDPPSWQELGASQARVCDVLIPALAALLEGRAAPAGLVALGGASKRVARAVAGARPPARVTLEALLTCQPLLFGKTARAIGRRTGLGAASVPTTRVGALILAEVLRAARLRDCEVSPFGIREGAILAAAAGREPSTAAARAAD